MKVLKLVGGALIVFGVVMLLRSVLTVSTDRRHSTELQNYFQAAGFVITAIGYALWYIGTRRRPS